MCYFVLHTQIPRNVPKDRLENGLHLPLSNETLLNCHLSRLQKMKSEHLTPSNNSESVFAVNTTFYRLSDSGWTTNRSKTFLNKNERQNIKVFYM